MIEKRPKCEKHGKALYPTSKAAEAAMQREQESWTKASLAGEKTKLRMPPIAVWQCPSTKQWHLTSRPRKNWGTAQRGGKNDRRNERIRGSRVRRS